MQVVVDGILTHYEIIGDKPRKLLILPGWMHSYNEWLPAAKKLSEKYTVILLDFPGFGRTPIPEKTFSIYDYAAFTEHFLNKLEIKQITLFGHSFGGRVSIILASKTDRIKQLFLIDAAGVEKRTTAANIKIALFKTAKLIMPKTFVEQLRNKMGSPDYKTAGPMRNIFIKVINEDLTYLLPKISAQTILIWGNKDTEVPEWKTKLMSKLIPHSHLRVVWGAYHSPHLEKPREFMELLDDYLLKKE